MAFAHRVVKPMAETIDFIGFSPLLKNLGAVLNYHVSVGSLVEEG